MLYYHTQKPSPEQHRTLATMLGLPIRYAARAARVLELWEQPRATQYKITRPIDVYNLLTPLRRARKEHLVGLYLNAQNGVVCQETISIGSLNVTRAQPREIFYPAISNLALGFVLAHNHPSGDLTASNEDIEFTRLIHRVSETLGIELLDHIIISSLGYTSLKEKGAF